MKPKLLWVSDNPKFQFVGQSRVTREFCNRLKNDFDVSVAGYGSVPEGSGLGVKDNIDYPIYELNRWDTATLITVIDKVKPHVLLLSHDIWMYPKLYEVRSKFPGMKIVMYATVDGEPFCRKWKPIADASDLIVTPSNWGKEVINVKFFDVPVEVVPYGVDSSMGKYRPVKDKKVLRNNMAPLGIPDFPNKFVAFSVGHSHTRKNWAAARDAWKIFSQGKPDVLYIAVIHSVKFDEYEWQGVLGEYDSWEFIKAGNILFIDQCITEDEYLRLLCASDVLLFPTIGEGFGLPIIEAMACGVVPIVTRFSSYLDFVTDENAFLMDGTKLVAKWDVYRMIVDAETVAEKLELAYQLWKNDYLTTKKERCVLKAREYSWDESAKKMTQLIFKELSLNRLHVAYEVR